MSTARWRGTLTVTVCGRGCTVGAGEGVVLAWGSGVRAETREAFLAVLYRDHSGITTARINVWTVTPRCFASTAIHSKVSLLIDNMKEGIDQYRRFIG